MRVLEEEEQRQRAKLFGDTQGRKVIEELAASREKEKAYQVPVSTDQGVSQVWKNLRTTRHSSKVATREISSGAAQKIVTPDATYEMTTGEDSKKKLENNRRHRLMYEAQLDRKGKFQPGPKAKWDANWREQEKCDHPFDFMRWGGQTQSASSQPVASAV